MTYRMSIIPAGAVTDRRLKPRDLQVICLFGRHINRQGWCSRSQVKMAIELGCARSTVQDAIHRLVTAGWLERRMVETECGRDAAHEYRVRLDDASGDQSATSEPEDVPPCRPVGTPAGISAPPADPGSAPLLTSLCELREEEREGARVREDSEADGLDAFLAAWPSGSIDDRSRTARAWQALTAEERQRAIEGVQAYLAELKRHGRRYTPSGYRYLDERSWLKLSPPTGSAEGVNCWSREWWAILLLRLERRRSPGFMIEYAADTRNKTITCKPGDMPTPAELASLTAYPSDGEAFAAWRPWFEARGSRFPSWRERQWVFLPSPRPPPASGAVFGAPLGVTGGGPKISGALAPAPVPCPSA